MTTDIEAKKNLDKLIKQEGSLLNVAYELNISQPLLSYHKNKPINEKIDRLPARLALAVEKLTEGTMKASDLAQVTFSP